MSDIIKEPGKRTLTPEQEMELEIEKQDDAVQIQARAVNDPFQNILYIAVQSQALGKKVVTHFKYIEETEDGKVVARSMQGGEQEILDFDAEINTTEPAVIKQRPIERG